MATSAQINQQPYPSPELHPMLPLSEPPMRNPTRQRPLPNERHAIFEELVRNAESLFRLRRTEVALVSQDSCMTLGHFKV